MKRSLRWLTFVLAFVMLFAAAGCNQAAPVNNEATAAPDGATPEPAADATPEPSPTPNPFAWVDVWNTELEKDIYYICLIGSDEESPEMYGCTYGHNDTTMILQVDVKNNTMKLASFMRDMYMEIPGQGKYRFNNAYFRGGPELVKQTIKKVFDINIDYYAKVNFTTFEQIMSIIGPIMIDVQAAEVEHLRIVESAVSKDGEQITSYNKVQSAGTHEFDEYLALSYARDRHSERELEGGKKVWNDLGRNDRQREIICASWEKVKGKEAVTIPAAVMAAQVYVDSDMEAGLMITLLKHFMESGATMEDKGFPSKGCWEILVNRKTGQEYKNSEIDELYQQAKAEYEAEDSSTGDGSEGGEGGESTEPAEEKPPFPSKKDWMKDAGGYDSVIGWSHNSNVRDLHKFFGID